MRDVKITRTQALALLSQIAMWYNDTILCAKCGTCDACRSVRRDSEDFLYRCESGAYLAPLGTKVRGIRRGCVVAYYLYGYSEDGSDVRKTLASIQN